PATPPGVPVHTSNTPEIRCPHLSGGCDRAQASRFMSSLWLMLNTLWLAFFLVSVLAALFQWLVLHDPDVFSRIVAALFEMAGLSVQIMVLLFGTLTLWLGFLRIAESAGLVERLARLLGPLFRRLMPDVPAGHPALGLITMNFAANGLGLD